MSVLEPVAEQTTGALEEVAVMLCGEDELPPTVRDYLPYGWQASGEVLDFWIDGEWTEAWILTRPNL